MPPQANRLLQIPKRANSRGEVNPHFHPTKTQIPPFTTLRLKMRPRSLLISQIHKLIIYHLALHMRDMSSQPETDDQLLQYLRTNPQPIVSPHPAKLSFSHPTRRKRSRDKRRKPGNNSSYRLKRSPLTLTSTRQSPLLHPPTTPFCFVDLPGAAEQDRYRSNREERPPYAQMNSARRPHLPLTNLQHSPLLVHGVKSI